MCLSQGHNAVKPVGLKPTAPKSGVKLSITESLHLKVFMTGSSLGHTLSYYLENILLVCLNRFHCTKTVCRGLQQISIGDKASL